METIKMYACDQCEYKTVHAGHVPRHVKSVHLKLKDFNCNQCDKRFSTNRDLKRHVKTVHDKIKDNVCDQCDYTCALKSDLSQHVKRVHEKIINHACNLCDFTCFKNSQLKVHRQSVHEKIKNFNCEQCTYKCSTKSTLATHIKRIHDNIKDFVCNKCEYKCSENNNLQRHIKICTGGRVGSSGEIKIKDVLDGFGINYIYNQSNDQLTRYCNKSLRFDFEIHLHGEVLFIEFDGRQHFEPQRFGNISQERAEANFRQQKKYDRIKNRFCNEYDYKLLRISYVDILEIKPLIIEFLQKFTLFGFEM